MKAKLFFVSAFLGAMCMLNAQNLNWHTYWGSNAAGSEIIPAKILVDHDGNIYTSALFGGTDVEILGEKTGSNASVNNGDAMLVKMSPSQQLIWKKTLVGSGTATITDMALDNDNNLVVTGIFTNTIRPDETNSMTIKDNTGYEENAGYVIRFSPSGEVLNMWQMASEGIKVNAVAVDNENNIYVSGAFDSEMSFNPEDDNALVGDMSKTNQLFVAKYSKTGSLLKLIMDDKASYTNAFVKTDKDGNMFVGGTFMGTTTIAETTLTTPVGVGNMILIKYRADGSAAWAKRIGGTWNDTAVGIELSVSGDVAICGNYLSEDITITGYPDTEHFNNGFPVLDAETRANAHIGVFTFEKESGDYRWWYSFGQGSTSATGASLAKYIRCSDEGVWYVGGRCSGRYGDSSTHPSFGNANSGIRLMDGTWVQHNTNGGADALYLVLSREGKLCSIGRPGSAQTEEIVDIALTPDKKGIYFYYNMLTRANQVIYTYIDNLWDSFTDMNSFGRTGQYAPIKVFSSETPNADNKYTVAGFSSALVAKYDFPEIEPNELPIYTVGEEYSQVISQKAAVGTSKFHQLMIPEELNFDNGKLDGTLTQDDIYYFGVALTDSVALPDANADGVPDITYYAQDPNKESIRGNSSVVRYFKLTTEIENSIPTIALVDVSFYPTICTTVLNVETKETNYKVNLYNQVGKMVGTYINAKSISVENLPSGFYFASLETISGAKNTVKFVKK